MPAKKQGNNPALRETYSKEKCNEVEDMSCTKRRSKMKKVMVVLCIGLIAFCLCGGKAMAAEGKLIIGILPEMNLVKQMEKYTPLCKYIGKKVGMEIGVKPLANYGLIYEEMRDGKIDAAFFGSFTYSLTKARLDIEPLARPQKADGNSTYSGLIFTRKETGIKGPADMKGKTMALVDPAATGGYVSQRAYLKKHGVDIDKDVKIFWTGSQDAAPMAVFNKQADFGGGKNHMFNKLVKENPAFKETMVVLYESPQVPDSTLAVKKSMDTKLREKIKNALLSMDKDPEGAEVLKKFGAEKFIETTDEDYKGLRAIAKDAGIDLKTYPYKKQ